MSFIAEMKRRKVLRAAFVYILIAWLLLQIVDVVGPILDLPGWVAKLIFFILLAGLPVMLVLSWQFDLTNLGVYRERPLESQIQSAATTVEDSQQPKSIFNCLACVWIVFVGTGLSFGAAVVIHLHEARLIDLRFELMAQDIAHEINHRIKSNSGALDTLKILFIEGQNPSFDSFRSLSEELIVKHEELKAVEWVPRVTNSNREVLVEKIRKIYPSFELKAFNTSGAEVKLADRNMYFPVTFTIPKTGNESAIGFDLLSNPKRALALQEAAQIGSVRQSATISLVQSGEPGFLLFNPVFESELNPVSQSARLATLKGFTLGVIDTRKLVQSAFLSSPGTAQFLGEISLYDSGEVNDQPIIQIDTSNGSELSVTTRALVSSNTGYGQSWLVELRPTRALVVSLFSSEHYLIGGIGMLLSVICSLLIYSLSKSGPIPISQSKLALSDSNIAEDKLPKISSDLMFPT